MPHITKGNVSKIISQIDLKKLPDNFGEIRGKVYKQTITFFNAIEQRNLLLRKELYKNPNAFLEVYKRITPSADTYSYIYEGGTPAYHYALDCPRLNSNFVSYEIPLEIQDRGKEEVIRFRTFYGQNKELLDRNPEAFYIKMTTAFALAAQLKPVDYHNSGAELIDVNNLAELEGTINSLLSEVDAIYWKSSPQRRMMMHQFMRSTYLVFQPNNQDVITQNNTGFSDEEIREFLKYFAEKYKFPIIKYLKHFYRVYFNPDLEFEGELLEVLGFKKCSHCHSEVAVTS